MIDDELLNSVEAKILKLDPRAIASFRERPGMINVREWLPIPDLPHYNAMLGGGHVVGTIAEIYGDPGIGKSTLAFLYLVATQKLGGVVLLLDAEYSVTLDRLEVLGICTEEKKFRYWNITTIEDLNKFLTSVVESLATIKKKDGKEPLTMILMDSIAALTTEKELEKELGDQEYAWKAKLLSKVLRQIVNALGESRVSLICTNHTYTKMGQLPMYGDKEETGGGRAFKYFATHRIKIKRVDTIKAVQTDDEAIGHLLEASNVKCRTAQEKRKVRLAFMYASAMIDGPWSVFYQLSWPKKVGAVISSGARWTFHPNARKLFEGLPEKAFLRKEWPEVYATHKEAIDKLAVASVSGWCDGSSKNVEDIDTEEED